MTVASPAASNGQIAKSGLGELVEYPHAADRAGADRARAADLED